MRAFEHTLLGRVLPRGQRWIDDTSDEAASPLRDDPGYDRVSYLAWERDEDEPAWVVDYDEIDLVDRTVEPWEPDVWVTVNGVPLDLYLLGEGDSDAPFLVEVKQAHVAPMAPVYGNSASRHYRLWLWRQVDDDQLGWGPTKHGRRWNSRSRWKRGHGRSAIQKVASRALRRVVLVFPSADGKEVN